MSRQYGHKGARTLHSDFVGFFPYWPSQANKNSWACDMQDTFEAA
jgi:hypothetical protein